MKELQLRMYLAVIVLILMNSFVWAQSSVGTKIPASNSGVPNAKTDVKSNKWKWIAYGDTRTNDNYHRSVLQSIKTNTPDYRFIINVGDLIEDGRNYSLWNIWQSACDEILGGTGQTNRPPKYMAVPGNHEYIYESAGFTNWKAYLFGQAQQFPNDGKYFYFDYENARFILLNSETTFTGRQAELLSEAVRTNPHPWLFAFWHRPIFDFGPKTYESTIHTTWGIPLYNYGCDIMFMGHAHYYVRTKKLNLNGQMNPPLDTVKGTVQIVTGNGGSPPHSVDENKIGRAHV